MLLIEKLKKLINDLEANKCHIAKINIHAITKNSGIIDSSIIRKDTGKRILIVHYISGPEAIK